jgi:hypothetical protein
MAIAIYKTTIGMCMMLIFFIWTSMVTMVTGIVQPMIISA